MPAGKDGLVNSTDQRDGESDKQENCPGCSGTAFVLLQVQQSLGCRIEMARDKTERKQVSKGLYCHL